MRYLLLGVLLVLLVGQHVALTLVPVDTSCEQEEAPSPSGCEEVCPLCACCLDRTPALAPEFVDTAPSRAPESMMPVSTNPPPTPEPAEILHVPKPLLT
jgi:hypothetical protein